MNQKRLLDLVYKHASADKIDEVRRLFGEITQDVFESILEDAYERKLEADEIEFIRNSKRMRTNAPEITVPAQAFRSPRNGNYVSAPSNPLDETIKELKTLSLENKS